MDSEVLYHHGILGMKWGIRRTPEQLGHRTSSGKKRTKKTSDESAGLASRIKSKFSKKSKTAAKTSNEKKTHEELSVEEKKTAVLKTRSAKVLYDNASLFTTQELRTAYERLKLEQDIKNLTPKEVNKGEQYVSKLKTASDAANKVSSLLKSSRSIYNTINDWYGGDEDKKKSSGSSGDSQGKQQNQKTGGSSNPSYNTYNTYNYSPTNSGNTFYNQARHYASSAAKVADVYSYASAGASYVTEILDETKRLPSGRGY